MTKLPEPFDPRAHDVWKLRNARRIEEAKAIVRERMRTGKASAMMKRQAAELFGGREASGPYRVIDIAEDFEALRRDGVSAKEAISALAEKYMQSEKHIEACVTLYREAVKDNSQ